MSCTWLCAGSLLFAPFGVRYCADDEDQGPERDDADPLVQARALSHLGLGFGSARLLQVLSGEPFSSELCVATALPLLPISVPM